MVRLEMPDAVRLEVCQKASFKDQRMESECPIRAGQWSRNQSALGEELTSEYSFTCQACNLLLVSHGSQRP